MQSIDDQLDRLNALAKDLRLQIKAVYTEARSAKMPDNRPLFGEMLMRIERGEADGILCWQINRLSRNPIDSGRLGWLLQQGVLKSIQTIDREYLSDDNVLLFNVESGMANQFIIDLRKNIRRGIDGKIGRGWFPGYAPLGYLNDRTSRTIIRDPERFTLVRRMWDLMLTGSYTPPQIRRIANEQWGFRTPRRHRSGGTSLSNSFIYTLFSNIFYTGLFEWCGRQHQGKHDAMITLDEYDRVQMLLGRKGRPRPKTRHFAFTGMIRCGECSAMHTAEEKTKFIKTTGKLKTYVYYHCTRRKTTVDCSQRKTLIVDALERQIEQRIEKFTILPEFLGWALEYVRTNDAKKSAELDTIDAMRRQALRDTEHELTNLIRMRCRDQIDEGIFVSEQTRLENTLAQLKAKQNVTTDESGQLRERAERSFMFAAHARTAFLAGTSEQKREILETLGQNPTIKDRIFSIEAAEWLETIGEKYPALEAEYIRLELNKSPLSAREIEALYGLRLRWWSIVEDVGTKVRGSVPPAHIPLLPYVQDQSEIAVDRVDTPTDVPRVPTSPDDGREF